MCSATLLWLWSGRLWASSPGGRCRWSRFGIPLASLCGGSLALPGCPSLICQSHLASLCGGVFLGRRGRASVTSCLLHAAPCAREGPGRLGYAVLLGWLLSGSEESLFRWGCFFGCPGACHMLYGCSSWGFFFSGSTHAPLVAWALPTLWLVCFPSLGRLSEFPGLVGAVFLQSCPPFGC